MNNQDKKLLEHALGIISGRLKREEFDYELLKLNETKLINREYEAKERAEEIILYYIGLGLGIIDYNDKESKNV